MKNWQLSILFGLSSIASSALAQDQAPESLGITEVVYNGTGCPAGTVGTYVSEDRLAMTLMFDNYAVELVGQNSTKANKSCNIRLKLVAPAGWSVSLISTDFRGYGNLDAGVIGEQTSVYRFGVARWSDVGLMRVVGPTAMDYVNSTNVDPSGVEWSPCIKNDRQAQIFILTQISLSKHVSNRVEYGRLQVEAGILAESIRSVESLLKSQLPNSPLLPVVRKLLQSSEQLQAKAAAKASAADLNVNISNLSNVWLDLRKLSLVKKNRRGVAGLWKIKRFEVALTNITAIVNPAKPDAKGLLTMDTADAEVKQEYGLMWKKCDPNSIRFR